MAMQGNFEVFFDGDCPLCTKEINVLRRLDKDNRIIFTDIADAAFDAEAATGLNFETLMNSIHGRMPDGALVEGVEVFRQLYGRVGLGGVVWLTRLPGIRQGLDASYRVFARNRLSLTGRCAPDGTCDIGDQPTNLSSAQKPLS